MVKTKSFIVRVQRLCQCVKLYRGNATVKMKSCYYTLCLLFQVAKFVMRIACSGNFFLFGGWVGGRFVIEQGLNNR